MKSSIALYELEFLYRRPEAAGKRGKDRFVDDPFLGGVIGIVINRERRPFWHLRKTEPHRGCSSLGNDYVVRFEHLTSSAIPEAVF